MFKSNLFTVLVLLSASTSAHAFANQQDAVVMPVSFGGDSRSLAFIKIEGTTAHQLFDAMKAGQLLRKDLATSSTLSSQDRFDDVQENRQSVTIESADQTGSCLQMTTVKTDLRGRESRDVDYSCELFLQPITK